MGVPVGADTGDVLKLVRFAAVVLPVVSVDAGTPVMLVSEGTELGLEVEDVEVVVLLVVVDKLYPSLVLGVGKAAV